MHAMKINFLKATIAAILFSVTSGVHRKLLGEAPSATDTDKDIAHKASNQAAAPAEETLWDRRYLTGDWGGVYTRTPPFL